MGNAHLAAQASALRVKLQHRFSGDSLPTNKTLAVLSEANLRRVMRVEQVLADIAMFVADFRRL